MLRTLGARLVILPLGGALALAAPVPAGAVDTEPAVVVNGTFSSPRVPEGSTWVSGVEGWSGNGALASATRAGHPQGFQGAALNYLGRALSISTRLRGVRSGATVTLSWDDNPDTCVSAGGPARPYKVTVDGAANTPGAFTTKAPTGQPNWYLGRSYSFTAAEDAPQITFTSTDTVGTACAFLIANVQAKQSAPPLAPPTGVPSGAAADPCAGEAASSPQCTTAGGNQAEIDKCPAGSRDCLASVAGSGETQNTAIANQTQAVQDFADTPRDQDPNTAAQQLCSVTAPLTDGVPPQNMVIPPSDWWYC